MSQFNRLLWLGCLMVRMVGLLGGWAYEALCTWGVDGIK